MTKKRTRALAWGALVAVALIVAAGLAMTMQRADADAPRPTVRAERGDLVEVASVSGTIEPHAQVDVHSRLAGEVVEVAVEEGQSVEQGDVLFRLDPSDAQRALRTAESEVVRARAALAEASAQVASAQASARDAQEDARVGERGVELGLTAPDAARQSAHDRDVAATQVALRRAQVSSARAQLAAAELAVEEARRNVERTDIRAPFAGTVLSVGVERGSIVSSPMGNVSGGTTLVTIADLRDLRVIGQLDEAQIGRVQVGQEVTFRVDAYADRTFAGRVHRVSPLGVVDTNVVVFDVEIVVTDPDVALLRSGMSADVEIVTARQEGALLVPLTAIRSRGAVREVELAGGSRRAVRTGATDGDHIVVVEGLEEGDEIVADSRSARASSEAPAQRSGLLPGPPRGGRR
ncbi:efflux RND transporter periplasmic adaptor subunit [Sandaracinus amylolyticus]|uniref:efflux RND transporter periplasmic adaptor subunit n=1 Tax=Sandaracinus amylolyticus TaxID=927083 RepID=UPI001EFFAAF5|nr:efflux RND transporter periplasmic adaptor subunit [Sandaracinus amylolyticus]UJR82488.1 Hypothetical protein I5071_45530 [Sandaracinus amylolyticus]